MHFRFLSKEKYGRRRQSSTKQQSYEFPAIVIRNSTKRWLPIVCTDFSRYWRPLDLPIWWWLSSTKEFIILTLFSSLCTAGSSLFHFAGRRVGKRQRKLRLSPTLFRESGSDLPPAAPTSVSFVLDKAKDYPNLLIVERYPQCSKKFFFKWRNVYAWYAYKGPGPVHRTTKRLRALQFLGLIFGFINCRFHIIHRFFFVLCRCLSRWLWLWFFFLWLRCLSRWLWLWRWCRRRPFRFGCRSTTGFFAGWRFRRSRRLGRWLLTTTGILRDFRTWCTCLALWIDRCFHWWDRTIRVCRWRRLRVLRR